MTTALPSALSRAADANASTPPERASGSAPELVPCRHATRFPACPGHDPRKCYGHGKLTKKACGNRAGQQTDHPGAGLCRMHGGSSPNGRTQGRNLAAAAALAEFGVAIEKDPAQALLELVWEAAGNVAFLRGRVQAMVTDEHGRAGLIGDVMALTKDGYPIAVSEEARAMVKLYGEWTDRLEKYASAAVKAGVAQRIVDLVERQADVIAAALEHVLRGCGLSPDDSHVRSLISEAFTTVVPAVLAAQRN